MADKDFNVPGANPPQHSSPNRLPKFEAHSTARSYTGPPAGEAIGPAPSYSWYDPRGWSLRRKLLLAAITIAVIIGVVVGAVEGAKTSRYPSYTPLNYKLIDTYSGATFLDRFNYYSDEDPTDGFVHYVTKETATKLNLTHATDTSVTLRVDTSDPSALTGRQSVRLESKSSYDSGLFVFDIIHSPYGCGTWPALWLTDPSNWPVNGEIDVLETNNRATQGNAVTLHTTEGCGMDVKRKQTGTALYATCDNSTHGNAGCGVEGDPSTYGEAMNARGGGVSLATALPVPAKSTRSTRSSSGAPGSAPGSSRARLSHPTSATGPIRRNGARRWRTSPARTATWRRTSATRA